jgi:chromatin remodeling complex protein RSC6
MRMTIEMCQLNFHLSHIEINYEGSLESHHKISKLVLN